MLFLDKIEKGIIYVMGQKVHRDNEAEYLGLLEEARRTEQRLYGVHEQEWEEQKYLNRLRKQQKRQERKTKELEMYWALERANISLFSILIRFNASKDMMPLS